MDSDPQRSEASIDRSYDRCSMNREDGRGCEIGVLKESSGSLQSNGRRRIGEKW